MDRVVKRKKFLEIEYYRKKYLFTQENFATLLGITVGTYSHKETGRIPLMTDELLLIHGAINMAAKKAGESLVTVDDLLGL